MDISFNPRGKADCNNFIRLNSVSNRLMVLNLTEEFASLINFPLVALTRYQENDQYV